MDGRKKARNYERKDTWTCERMNGRTDRRTNGRRDRRTKERTNEGTDVRTKERSIRWTDALTNEVRDGRTNIRKNEFPIQISTKGDRDLRSSSNIGLICDCSIPWSSTDFVDFSPSGT
ncbi:hypothetical protein DPMN_057265 [Dreissena polymorpha]|uniref:Uncharacterized protein n=1 Tax=Dreissena polymorpha TaxID=45954 RepID=A0A9D4CV85_DREPO|nr:hypothetical protein DPMN_057265 [Dreissena polymorpha]